MKTISTILCLLVLVTQLMAQSPVKKWQGASSNDWDYISANWVPIEGLPFPATFEAGDDVLLDDTRNEGQDSISVVGEINAANVTFNNSAAVTYALYSADATAKIMGEGTIYKENNGDAIVGVNVEMAGGIIARQGKYVANNPDGSINAFGPKVTFEGGYISINKDAVDNPTYNAPFDIHVAEGQSGGIITPRRVNLVGKATGSGTLDFISNGERDFIDLTNGANWSEFTGQVNVIKGDDEILYTPGFYGLCLQTDSSYVIEIDDTIGTGTITETGVDLMLSTTKIHMGSSTTLGTWSGNRCIQIGELTGGEDATIFGYVKKSTTPNINYSIGSANTDFTLSSRFTGEQGSGDDYRRYNTVGFVKVGTGTMTLNHPANYVTGMIVVKEGKLFISNPEGSVTGTGYLSAGIPLIVGPGAVLGGIGSISRNVDVYGTIEPGEDAVGKLTIQDSSTVVGLPEQVMFQVIIKKVGGLTIEIGSATEYDVLAADSFMIEGGKLTVLPAATYNLVAGETYQVLQGAFKLESAAFDSISLPFTDEGWEWDLSNLYVDGSVTLTSGGGSGTYNPEDPGDPGVSVNEFSIDKEVSIYPNPSSGKLSLELPAAKGISMKVIDASGKTVFARNIHSTLTEIDINDKLSNGLYLVRIETTEGIVTRKLLVQK
ncbi:MAG: T9SS type A sorting domain-containing protein [Prolixibacteraceae bacterium]|nr:T9SS type A sorting domain-containing protein [Prolixibacteraceae bacterium]